MRKLLGKILITLVLAFVPILMTGIVKPAVSALAEEVVYHEYIADASKMTCSAFTEYTTKDTHRTRIVVQSGVPEWGEICINNHPYETESALLHNIMVNGKSVFDHRKEYIDAWLHGTAPEIISTDYYFEKDLDNSCPIHRPINVILYYDASLSANTIDIYIPESYLSPLEVVTVGFVGKGSVLSYTVEEPAIFRIQGEVSIRNPNLPPPKPVYTVTVDGIAQKLEEDSLIPKPEIQPTKEETISHVYEFIGWAYEEAGEKKFWNFETDTVKGDLTLTAEFSAIEKPKYRFTFDGKEVYAYEGSRLEKPEEPENSSTLEYVYTFEGWFYEKDGVSYAWNFDQDVAVENVTLTSRFSCRKAVYCVYVYVQENSDEYSVMHLEWGMPIRYPLVTGKFGYEVAQWLDENGNVAPTIMPTNDIYVYADWQLKAYTLYVFEGENELLKKTYTTETAETALQELRAFLPTLYNAAYKYVWKKSLPENLPFIDEIAYYVEKVAIEYTITFKGVKGVKAITFTAETMESVCFPSVPKKIGYVGAWDKRETDLTLSNMVVTAVYTKEEPKDSSDTDEEIYKNETENGCGGRINGIEESLIFLSLFALLFIRKKVENK